MRIGIRDLLKLTVVALVALALVAFITGCSSSGGSDDAAAHEDADEVAEHVEEMEMEADEGGGTVHVALNEWSISPAHGEGFEAGAGDVVFEIHNEGAAPHDFKIIKTDLAADALPISGGVVDQEAAGEVIGGVDPIPSGEIYVEPYDLEAGNYVIICTIPGHYQQGMFAELTVQ